MEENIYKSDSLHINGAFSASAITISDDRLELSENADAAVKNFMKKII